MPFKEIVIPAFTHCCPGKIHQHSPSCLIHRRPGEGRGDESEVWNLSGEMWACDALQMLV